MQIGTAHADPGEFARGEIEITELPTGPAETIPVMIARGEDSGPTLFVTAAIHGNEVTGLAAAYDAVTPDLVDRIRGTVVCLPILNPAGLRRTARRSYYHDQDPNRHFSTEEARSRPPHVQGLINDRIYGLIEESADALVSLHTAATGSMPFTIVERVRYGEDRSRAEAEELAEAELRLVEAFGLPPIREFDPTVHESTNLDRSLEPSVLNGVGIPSFTVELGSPNAVEERHREAAVIGIENVLRAMDILSGDPEPNEAAPEPPVDYPVKRARHPRTETPGIVRRLVEVGTAVEAGDPMAEILAPDGEVRTTVEADTDGYVIGRRRGVAAYENDALFSMAVRDESDVVVSDG